MFAKTYKDSQKEQSYSSDLTWEEWLWIKELIPISRRGAPIRIPLKDVVDAIFYINKNGCKWEDLPHDFPPYRRVHEWYMKWVNDGTWGRILNRLREETRQEAGREPCPSEGCIDSQTVKVDASAGERAYDGAKKINGRKRHILVDTLGLLIAVVVTVGDVPDAEGGVQLLRKIGQTQCPRLRKFHVDAAYKNNPFPQYIAEHPPYEIVIRSKPKEIRRFVPLKKRWVVERTFAWFGKYRRLVRDYERDLRSSEAMIQVAMIHVMLKRKSKRRSKDSHSIDIPIAA